MRSYYPSRIYDKEKYGILSIDHELSIVSPELAELGGDFGLLGVADGFEVEVDLDGDEFEEKNAFFVPL